MSGRVYSDTELIHEILCMAGSAIAAMASGGMAILLLRLADLLS